MEKEIRNARGERLDFTFHGGAPGKSVVVVIGHGVTGNKDRPLVVALADGLAKAGFGALRFSFSGNGGSEGDFRESTLTKEVEDLGAVFDALEGRTIYYVGHSMGAAVGVLRASGDPRVKALVSLAGMVYTAAFADTEFGDETPDAGSMWEDEDFPLSSAFMRAMHAVASVLDLAPKITIPWLLVHGTEDDVVPYQESVDMFARANEPKRFLAIEGGGHVFANEATEPMVTGVVEWVKGLG